MRAFTKHGTEIEVEGVAMDMKTGHVMQVMGKKVEKGRVQDTPCSIDPRDLGGEVTGMPLELDLTEDDKGPMEYWECDCPNVHPIGRKMCKTCGVKNG